MVMAEIESQERGILKILIFLRQKRLDQTIMAEYYEFWYCWCWKIWFCISYKTHSGSNKHKSTSFM